MMPFRDQQYFMHKNARDVCIQVIKVQFIGPDYVRLKADYINLGYAGTPYRMQRMNNFIVKKKEYENWVWLLPEFDLFIPRTESGLPRRVRDAR